MHSENVRLRFGYGKASPRALKAATASARNRSKASIRVPSSVGIRKLTRFVEFPRAIDDDCNQCVVVHDQLTAGVLAEDIDFKLVALTLNVALLQGHDVVVRATNLESISSARTPAVNWSCTTTH